MILSSILIVLLLFVASERIVAEDLQPKAVVTIEKLPARKVFGSISLPKGSPWCDGKPTYWLVGHQPTNESPWCLVSNDGTTDFTNYNYTDSLWQMSSVAVLDTQDELNTKDGPTNLDRHDCAIMDVNKDGEPDVLCGVGANRGTGDGFNEVYLTQTQDNGGVAKNSLVKILEGHGLHRFPTMRNRLMVNLKGADGSPLVFLATRGQKREDGKPNQHRMFRLEERGPHGFFFNHVFGPWVRYTIASCLHAVDVNQDGLDDILICNKNKPAFIFLQQPDNSWSRLQMVGQRAKDWRNARVADVDGDGVNDLIVVGSGGQTPTETSYVRVFKGLGKYPYFDLIKRSGRLYERSLPYASPDVQVLDVNRDGIADLYVVQVDEATSGSYCASKYQKTWSGAQPPESFVPDRDVAADLLLLGSESGDFTEVVMQHSEPGCGSMVELFGNNHTMILAQGNNGRPGHNLLLQW